MYATRFVFDSYDIDPELLKKELMKIRVQDKTFRFSIKQMPDGKYRLNIYSEDEETAHKRGLWVWDKLFNKVVGYKVVEL